MRESATSKIVLAVPVDAGHNAPSAAAGSRGAIAAASRVEIGDFVIEAVAVAD